VAKSANLIGANDDSTPPRDSDSGAHFFTVFVRPLDQASMHRLACIRKRTVACPLVPAFARLPTPVGFSRGKGASVSLRDPNGPV